MTVTGTVLGTPSFMAPEQASSESKLVDRRTDVYGLGATLYSLLSGRPPFVGDSALTIIFGVLNQEPDPLRKITPEVPADLATVVMKCLEKESRRRYASARALADDLGLFLDG